MFTLWLVLANLIGHGQLWCGCVFFSTRPSLKMYKPCSLSIISCNLGWALILLSISIMYPLLPKGFQIPIFRNSIWSAILSGSGWCQDHGSDPPGKESGYLVLICREIAHLLSDFIWHGLLSRPQLEIKPTDVRINYLFYLI